jgi:DNA processing protein
MAPATAACDRCVRRTWLLERLSRYLEFQRRGIGAALAGEDSTLIDRWLEVAERRGLVTDVRLEYERFGAAQAEAARDRAAAVGLELICVCDPSYPERLRRLRTPPAVIHVAGGMARFLELADADPVAIVGTRRPTFYGTEVARMLGRGASVSGLSVVSGMAMGIDSAAHRGALAGGGRTIAVLASSAAQPYPKTNGALYEQILRTGVVVSELGVGATTSKWGLIARNRTIAALSELTVVVQGRARSGALRTAEFTTEIGSRLGAVPGSVLAPQSEGPHSLLRDGATLIRDPQDILDAICGVGARSAIDLRRSVLSDAQRNVLAAIRQGVDTLAALDRAGIGGEALLTLLAELELAGCLRRGPGGRYLGV